MLLYETTSAKIQIVGVGFTCFKIATFESANVSTVLSACKQQRENGHDLLIKLMVVNVVVSTHGTPLITVT